MPATSAQALANTAGIHPSTLTQTLKRLEKKKYILIAEDPKDSRKKLVLLTRSGKTILDLMEMNMGRWSKNLSHIERELALIHSSLENQLCEEFR